MACIIHHGPQGSYKTSGSIQNDMVPAIKQGRVIITNIRGMSTERIRDNLKFKKWFLIDGVIPDSFEIIHIDTKTEEGQYKMATFFHWAPFDAFIFMDEVNTIYHKSLRQADINAFDYPGGNPQAVLDDRPTTLSEALEMHRHYNWDLVFTTPNIKFVHDVVRGNSEGAYRHKNQALIGLKGVYQEILHAAADDGKSKSHHLSMRNRTMKPYVFNLYKSTKTGNVRDTTAGRNILLTPQVFGFVFFFLLVGYWLYDTGVPTAFKSAASTQIPDARIPEPAQNAVINNPVNNTSTLPAAVVYVVPDFLTDYEVYYAGTIRNGLDIEHQIKLIRDNKTLTISGKWLNALGYEMKRYGECLMELSYHQVIRIITCPLTDVENLEAPQSAVPPDFQV